MGHCLTKSNENMYLVVVNKKMNFALAMFYSILKCTSTTKSCKKESRIHLLEKRKKVTSFLIY